MFYPFVAAVRPTLIRRSWLLNLRLAVRASWGAIAGCISDDPLLPGGMS